MFLFSNYNTIRGVSRAAEPPLPPMNSKNFKPSPLSHCNYSRSAADDIRNFKIFEPPPLTPIININNFHLYFP
jgi:hypothetical protein